MSLKDTCHKCGHELLAGMCVENYCKCDCLGDDYE
jgi:hypothetical protein